MTIRSDMFICFAGGHRFLGACGRNATTPSPIPEAEPPRPSNVAASSSTDNHRYNTDELVEWAKSFKSLLDSAGGRQLFKIFLKSEYSQENILFYEACIDLEETEDEDEIFDKIRNIYEDYVSTLSPREVSLTSWIRDEIQEKMINPKKNIFETAKKHVYNLMLQDSYPRFKHSSTYKTALEKSQQSEEASTSS